MVDVTIQAHRRVCGVGGLLFRYLSMLGFGVTCMTSIPVSKSEPIFQQISIIHKPRVLIVNANKRDANISSASLSPNNNGKGARSSLHQILKYQID